VTLPIEINGRQYVSDIRGIQRQPLASVRQMQDSSREPSDRSLDNPAIWKRSRSDFIQGAGQLFVDQEDEADPRRFRTSLGIDVWDRRQMTLLNDTATGTTIGNGATGAMVVTENHLYMASAGAASRFDGTTWTACTGLSNNIKSLVVIGGHVYAASGGTLRRATVGGTAFSVFGSTTPDVAGTGGGRLVGGDGVLLYEILNDGSKTDIFTHFNGAGFTWNKIVAAPNGIYCVGADGSNSTVWLLTVVDASGELAAPYPCLDMPDGEFIRDLLFYGGVFVVATNLGVRLASINGSGFLTLGPLIEIGDVECLCTDGRDVWFGWTNFDGTHTGLGRIRPERFTDEFTPAYASDVMAVAQGAVKACASFQGKRVFLYGPGTTAVEQNTKVASGSLWTGGITYGTPEPVGAQSLEGQYDALPAGSSVTIDLLDGIDGPSLASSVDNTTASRRKLFEIASPPTGDEFELKFTLTRATDTSVSPTLRRWTLRSILQAYRTEEIIVPIMLFHEQQHGIAGQHIPQDLDPLAEWQALQALMQDRSIVDFRMGSVTQKVLVDAVQMTPQVQDVGLTRMTKNEDWFQGAWAVRLLTIS
jgi:hypothetical protein